jgi:prevent-host-death family protein
MKEVTIRELHARTGACVREAAEWGRIIVKDHGRPVATILPYKEDVHGHTPFSERKLAPGFAALPPIEGDCTAGISEDRGGR